MDPWRSNKPPPPLPQQQQQLYGGFPYNAQGSAPPPAGGYYHVQPPPQTQYTPPPQQQQQPRPYYGYYPPQQQQPQPQPPPPMQPQQSQQRYVPAFYHHQQQYGPPPQPPQQLSHIMIPQQQQQLQHRISPRRASQDGRRWPSSLAPAQHPIGAAQVPIPQAERPRQSSEPLQLPRRVTRSSVDQPRAVGPSRPAPKSAKSSLSIEEKLEVLRKNTAEFGMAIAQMESHQQEMDAAVAEEQMVIDSNGQKPDKVKESEVLESLRDASEFENTVSQFQANNKDETGADDKQVVNEGSQRHASGAQDGNESSSEMEISDFTSASTSVQEKGSNLSAEKQLSIEEELSRLDGKFVNVVHLVKRMPSVVKEIDSQARQAGKSLMIYCTSEQCQILLQSQGLESRDLNENSDSFDPRDVLVLVSFMDCSAPSASTMLRLLRSGGTNFYLVSCFGPIQEKWSRFCQWFRSEWRIYSVDNHALETFG
eukprot:TRINITY_DN9265_c0_g1_i2.p1 TRINITY_DN9265_c0_g1~~TRINITY_DN9265_c0_g1_i2.p1  ORF type:complete len:480 (+),score=96.94 TRINITY_DN9265_c0_g1_i2:871-2310(+)